MKTIGLLGGMSWESTLTYYSLINSGVRDALGGLHSAKIILYSVEFATIERLQNQGQWDKAGDLLANAAKKIESAGADCLLICTNTMHKVAAEVEAEISIPLIHIADATALAITSRRMTSVGLLGTRFTMEDDFYRGRLEKKFGITVYIPEDAERSMVHRVIYDELCCGTINNDSRKAFTRVVDRLAEKGAQAVILGCTEISLLIRQQDTPIPLFDTTAIHAGAAVRFALSSSGQGQEETDADGVRRKNI